MVDKNVEDFDCKFPHSILIENINDLEVSNNLKIICIKILGESCESKIEKLVHPDIFYLQNNDKIIHVNEIRNLQNKIYLKPVEANSKIYIIFADDITIQAQNAFLKILEDPPENVYFIFVCKNYKLLLPTIISRLTILNFKKKDNKNLIESKKDICSEISEKLFIYLKNRNEYEIIKLMNNFIKKREIFKKILILTQKKLISESIKDEKLIKLADNFSNILELINKNINLNLIVCIILKY